MRNSMAAWTQIAGEVMIGTRAYHEPVDDRIVYGWIRSGAQTLIADEQPECHYRAIINRHGTIFRNSGGKPLGATDILTVHTANGISNLGPELFLYAANDQNVILTDKGILYPNANSPTGYSFETPRLHYGPINSAGTILDRSRIRLNNVSALPDDLAFDARYAITRVLAINDDGVLAAAAKKVLDNTGKALPTPESRIILLSDIRFKSMNAFSEHFDPPLAGDIDKNVPPRSTPSAMRSTPSTGRASVALPQEKSLARIAR